MSEQTPADTLAADVLAIVQRMTARYAAIDRQRAAKQLQAAVERYRVDALSSIRDTKNDGADVSSIRDKKGPGGHIEYV